MARSLAILLMLEGHFIHATLHNREHYEAAGTYPIFEAWSFVRGFTSTIFLTVTGLVFGYLLIQKRHEPFFASARVRKGFRRAAELLLWGYFLQPGAFHVLQCIAVALVVILLLDGLQRAVRVVPLGLLFLVAGTLVFYLQTFLGPLHENLRSDPNYGFPESAPAFVQNMIFAGSHRAIFPLVPNLGYPLLGAAIGCLLQSLKGGARTWSFAGAVTLTGMALYAGDAALFSAIDTALGAWNLPSAGHWRPIAWLFGKFGGAVTVLGALLLIERLTGPMRPNLFLKIGQNTLPIFVLHFIILYGGIGSLWRASLDPYEAAAGAVAFIAFFVLLVRHRESLQTLLASIFRQVGRASAKFAASAKARTEVP